MSIHQNDKDARISIHAPRGGSDGVFVYIYTISRQISIHAPRGGSDWKANYWLTLTYDISIHAPRGGSDVDEVLPGDTFEIFQSTLPAGGATSRKPGIGYGYYISIHAPRGGSDRILRKR